MSELISSKEQALRVLFKLRERLVGFMNDVHKTRWRASEKAMQIAAYQQEVEALTLAIMALEQQHEEKGNGHQATN